MRCRELQDLIMTYIAGKLPPDRAVPFEAHLKACPLCRDAYAEEVEMTAAFDEDAPGLVNDGFTLRVMDAIDAAEEAKASADSVRPGSHRADSRRADALPGDGPRFVIKPLILAAAGVAAAALLAGYWIFTGTGITAPASAAPYIAQVREGAHRFLQGLGSLFNGLYQSGNAAYESAWSQVSLATSSHLSIICVVTALASVACAVLAVKFRKTIAKELTRS